MKCKIDGCHKKRRAGTGWCPMHYMRWRRLGSTDDPKAYLRPNKRPTVRDLEWAAGFLEGEGSFCTSSHKRPIECVEAGQVNREPLNRIREIFGGSCRLTRPKAGPRGNRSPYWRWYTYGKRARGIMLTLFPLLSQRRQMQIRQAIDDNARPDAERRWRRRQQVLDIRQLYATGAYPYRELAVRFGVHTDTIGAIVRRGPASSAVG